MKTVFLLMAEFETPTIPLELVREKYFGLKSKAEADRKASSHKLPIAAFKAGGQRSPYLIHVQDLAEFIDKMAADARSARSRINAA